jgi:hypothetical protein
MLFFGYENGKFFTLRGIASYSLEKNFTGNGSTRIFNFLVTEKITYPHVSVYSRSGGTSTRVRDNLYTVSVNTATNLMTLTFTTAPANLVRYVIFISNTQI